MKSDLKGQLGVAMLVLLALVLVGSTGMNSSVYAQGDNAAEISEEDKAEHPDRPVSDDPDDDSVITPDPATDMPLDDTETEAEDKKVEEQPAPVKKEDKPERTESVTDDRSNERETREAAPIATTGPSDFDEPIPATGIGSVLSATAGLGAIVGSTYYYRQSLLAQKNAIFRRDK